MLLEEDHNVLYNRAYIVDMSVINKTLLRILMNLLRNVRRSLL